MSRRIIQAANAQRTASQSPGPITHPTESASAAPRSSGGEGTFYSKNSNFYYVDITFLLLGQSVSTPGSALAVTNSSVNVPDTSLLDPVKIYEVSLLTVSAINISKPCCLLVLE